MEENNIPDNPASASDDHSGRKLIEVVFLILFILLISSVFAYAGYIYGKLKMQNEKLKTEQKKSPSSATPEQQPMTEPTVGLETDSKNKEKNLPSPTTQSKPTQDPTADWKTYTNRYWGFSLKYPPEELVACDYITEKEGLRLWPAPFDCPIGHDALYEIGVEGYPPGEYRRYKDPVKEEKFIIDGREATKATFIYDINDGPLAGIGQSIAIEIPVEKGTIVIEFLGQDIEKEKRFYQILNTFRILDENK